MHKGRKENVFSEHQFYRFVGGGHTGLSVTQCNNFEPIGIFLEEDNRSPPHPPHVSVW